MPREWSCPARLKLAAADESWCNFPYPECRTAPREPLAAAGRRASHSLPATLDRIDLAQYASEAKHGPDDDYTADRRSYRSADRINKTRAASIVGPCTSTAGCRLIRENRRK